MQDKSDKTTKAFALGGLAGNNAYGAGFLQAALEHEVRPTYLSCSSGQLLWVYRYLLAGHPEAESLREALAKDIAGLEAFHQPDADLVHLAVHGKPGVFRLASYEIALDTYKNMLSAFVEMAHNWGRTFFFKEFLGTLPARTLVPLFDDKFFSDISNVFNASDIAILFNSYDPRQGIEYVHMNASARERLGLAPGDKKSYRSRTIYRDVTPQYVRDALWLYQYRCTTRSQNAHGTEEREVLYPWHPWAGRPVHVHEVIEKAGWAAFRCSLTGVASDRRLEVPVWMFDRVASQGWQVRATPVASVAALGALAALLHDAAGIRDGAPQTRDSSAASGSQEAIPGDADATPTDTTTTRVVRPPQRRRSGPGAALADAAGGGAGDADRADGPLDPRPRRWRSSASPDRRRGS
jgi:hypothetical protein